MNEPELESLLEKVLSRPYRKVISGNDVDGYLAEALELPGCVTTGRSVVDALDMLQDAMEGWIEAALIAGEAVPEPEALARVSA